MRSTHRDAFRPEEAPSGVSVGRITVAPLCWAHEDKTWCEMFCRLARGWPGCQGEVLAPATPTCRGQEQCWVYMVVCDGHTYYTTMDRARDMYTIPEVTTQNMQHGEISGTTLAGLEFGQLEFVN